MSPRPVRTEGARELGRIAKRGTVAAIGAKVGVNEAAVRNWIAGRRTPNDASRRRIFEAYGISESAWTAPARVTSQGPPPTPAQDAPAATEPDVEAYGEPGGASGPHAVLTAPRPSLAAPGMAHRARLAAIVEQLEADIGACKGDVPANHKAALYGQLQRAVDRLAKFDGDEQLTVSAVLRSRAWREIETVLERALRARPEAAKAIAEALGRLAGGEPSR